MKLSLIHNVQWNHGEGWISVDLNSTWLLRKIEHHLDADRLVLVCFENWEHPHENVLFEFFPRWFTQTLSLERIIFRTVRPSLIRLVFRTLIFDCAFIASGIPTEACSWPSKARLVFCYLKWFNECFSHYLAQKPSKSLFKYVSSAITC